MKKSYGTCEFIEQILYIPPGPDNARTGAEGKELLKEKLVSNSKAGGTTIFTGDGTAGFSCFM